jgi:hypothetical protein
MVVFLTLQEFLWSKGILRVMSLYMSPKLGIRMELKGLKTIMTLFLSPDGS